MVFSVKVKTVNPIFGARSDEPDPKKGCNWGISGTPQSCDKITIDISTW
jgi:hypothetical protein